MTDEIDEIMAREISPEWFNREINCGWHPLDNYKGQYKHFQHHARVRAHRLVLALNAAGYEIRKKTTYDGKEVGSTNFGESNYGDLSAPAARRQRKVGE